jgi:O-methyltransferase
MNARRFLHLVYRALFDNDRGQRARFTLAEQCASFWCPKISLGGFGLSWLDDDQFFEFYRRFVPSTRHTADRKYFLRSLLALVSHLPGDTAECGAYDGASSWLICNEFRTSARHHFVFDSCEGLSAPQEVDGEYWKKGDMRAPEAVLRANLEEFPSCTILRGWIPDRFAEVSARQYCFVHVDVDLYQPTLDSLNFFYPRLVSGGILLFDDYGFNFCQGAARAVDETLGDKPEKLIRVPTGQAFIVKQ